jgi:hypothetical protein
MRATFESRSGAETTPSLCCPDAASKHRSIATKNRYMEGC